MKQVLLIQTHSFVDVITNSSTELFVCNTDKSIETVKKILEKKWKDFIKLYPYKYKYQDDPEEWTINEKSVWDVLYVQTGLTKLEKESKYPWGYEKTIKPDTIIITGTSDNSIPGEFFDVIEYTFNARSYHLG